MENLQINSRVQQHIKKYNALSQQKSHDNARKMQPGSTTISEVIKELDTVSLVPATHCKKEAKYISQLGGRGEKRKKKKKRVTR